MQISGNFWRVTGTFTQLTYLKQHPAELFATPHPACALMEHRKYWTVLPEKKTELKQKVNSYATTIPHPLWIVFCTNNLLPKVLSISSSTMSCSASLYHLNSISCMSYTKQLPTFLVKRKLYSCMSAHMFLNITDCLMILLSVTKDAIFSPLTVVCVQDYPKASHYNIS